MILPNIRIAAIGTGLLTFIVYLFTLAPTVGFIDSGELAAVSHLFGIAHPTGYPLYSLLSGLWAQLPFGDEIYRLNLLSAVFMSIAVGILTLVIYEFLGSVQASRKNAPQPKSKKKGKTRKQGAIHLPDELRFAAAAAGALIIGLSETYWKTALTNEVYPLHALFIALLLLLFRRTLLIDHDDAKIERRYILLLALVLGLSFSNHMTTIHFIPALVIASIMKIRRKKEYLRELVWGVPAFALGLLPYVYFPIRASANPPLNWGNPQTLENIIRHVSGKQYQVWIFSGTDATSRQLGYFLSSFPAEFGYLALAVIALGVFFAYQRNKRLAGMLTLLFAVCVVYSINYDIYDIDSYFLLAYIVSGIFAAYGIGWVTVRYLKSDIKAAAAVSVLCIGLMAGLHWDGVSESENYLVEDYTMNMFNSFEENALVISYQWDYWVSASYYYQFVKNYRPDVIVLDKELFRRSWYLDQIAYTFPDVYRKSEREFAEFREELNKFERDEPYNPQVIETRFIALINSIIERHYDTGPVYLTIEMEQKFAQQFARIPEGLAFRLYRPDEIPPLSKPVWDDFEYRPFARPGRLEDALRAMYANMLVNRGVLFLRAQNFQEAEAYARRALTFVPDHPTANQFLAQIMQSRQMGQAAPR
ncbi:MAG: hypothetical protein CL946_01870 [Ectothiorhodospiraceae bacterium]|nr:hypothetical protein [Ectothiorhodospiraceae bacterium]